MNDNQIVYDYSDVPTIWNYSQDNTRIRSLLGPFGSGKSSGGGVMEIVKRACEQAPGRDGIRRTRAAVIRNCYDDQTEILTENRGWQLFKNLLDSDRVAMLKDGYMVFENPSDCFAAPYKGEMIGIKSQNIDLLVTPDHGMHVSRVNRRRKKWSPFQRLTATQIYGKGTYRFKTNCDWIGQDIGLSENFMEFLGFWFAEGSSGIYRYKQGIKYRTVLTQSKFVQYVETLLLRNNLPFYKTKKVGGFRSKNICYDFVLNVTPETKKLTEWLSTLGKARTKFIPSWIKQAPKYHLKAFLHGYMVGDGHFREDFHDAETCSTSSFQLANDIQEISIKSGQTTTINYDKSNNSWTITFLTPKRSSPTTTSAKWYKQDYDGMVYCVTVSTHIVLVRRNFKVSWSYQTNRELFDTTMKTWDHWMKRFGHLEKTQKNFQIKMTASDGSPVECEVMFRPLDDPDDVDNLLSLELTFAWFNEVREIAKIIFDTMLSRVGRFPAMVDGGCTWSGIFGDTNPPDTDSWFYHLFEEERPLACPVCQNPDGGMVLYTPREIDGKPALTKCPSCGREENEGIPLTAIYKQPSGRSPKAENLRNLPKGYYTDMMVGKDPGWITVYVDGKYGYVRDGKPVYPNFSDHFHLVPNDKNLKELEVHPSYPLICGWDCTGNHQGWTINQRFPNGKFCTYDEIFAENTDARTFLQDTIKPFMWANYTGIPWQRIYVIMDPAAKRSDTNPSNAKKEAKMLGIENVFKAFSNSWDARFGAVNRLLIGQVEGGGMYQLNRRCKILHKGFLGEYMMERKQVSGKEIYKDQPIKNKASDLHDALQYAAMGPSREEEMDFRTSSRDHSGRINLGAHL